MNRISITMNRFLFRFLAAPEYRLLRHLALLVAASIITGSNIYYEFGEIKRLLPQILFASLLLLPIYLNVFLITPKLLFRNKVWLYFAAIACTVTLTLTVAWVAQAISERPFPDGLNRGAFLAINVSSALVSLLLIISGTSAVMLLQQKLRYGLRIEELEQATIRSELEQLKNQINPHFLFNMLNNANVLVREDPVEAEAVLHKLKDLLAYQFDGSTKEKVFLSDDIAFLSDYLKLEKIRRDNFVYSVEKTDLPDGATVPPLLFIPFVENAVKHGNDSRRESYVRLAFKTGEGVLDFFCENSKPPAALRPERGGLGLANIKRRLELLYRDDYLLEVRETETTYTVHLRIAL